MNTHSQTFRLPETKCGVSQKQNLSQKELYNKVLDYLSRREYTRYELQQKLTQYTNNQNDIASVLERLQERNLQSDKRFSENFIHSKQAKYGSHRLKETLKQKGVSLSVIQEYLPDFQEEIRNAISILHKKLGTPRCLSIEEKQKAYRFLQYRGFSAETTKTALRQWQEDNE